ncbi:MAG: MFS transporter [Elusimicrobia bacterium RIFOXYA2_FULL_58_8]|nr:MAG: MFS transporter [Elusimicrobia bacterium RIFOXYA12_FULL_57_11]OGS14584.1 MAG: MFS transporter [Elusimicrobia bacterium RIFOXYA2_FULL_58_8]
MTKHAKVTSIFNFTVLVAALGYFVDMFDLLLFPIVRQPSLTALGVAAQDQIRVGAYLLNWQMAGMLLGGILWGILGDKKGRLSTLFGSIALYSVANIANAYVQSIPAYALWRFLAGLGLAGELGAAVTLVSEILPRELRGYGTALVAGVGVFGTVTAALVGKYIPWRHAYLLGGLLGIALLFLRAGIRESLLYSNLSHAGIKRGDFFSLFTNKERLLRYLRCILIGLPMWFVVGILVIFIPEFAPILEVSGKLDPAIAVACCYSGITVGSLLSGFLSQMWGTRTKVIGLFMGMAFIGMAVLLLGRGFTPLAMYAVMTWLGLASGYWAVFVTVAAEQFGTNLRSTVATTVPNFVRGSVVLITNSFLLLKTSMGMLPGAWIVGLACFALAVTSLAGLKDTHGRDLDFVE